MQFEHKSRKTKAAVFAISLTGLAYYKGSQASVSVKDLTWIYVHSAVSAVALSAVYVNSVFNFGNDDERLETRWLVNVGRSSSPDDHIALGGMRVVDFMQTFHGDRHKAPITPYYGQPGEVRSAASDSECEHFVRAVVSIGGNAVLMGIDQCPSQTKYFTVGMVGSPTYLRKLRSLFWTVRGQVGVDSIERPFCDRWYAETADDTKLAYATPAYQLGHHERQHLVQTTIDFAQQFHQGQAVYGLVIGHFFPKSTNVWHCASFGQELLAVATRGRLSFSFSADPYNFIYNPRMIDYGAKPYNLLTKV